MKKVVLYARFSPRPNAKDCDSCDRQLEQLREWAIANEYDIMGEYRDDAVSGALDDGLPPPGLCEAIDSLRKHWTLIVRDVSRTCRDMALRVEVERRIKRKGARIHTLAEHASFDSPEQQLLYDMWAAFAQYQRRFSRAMTRARMRQHQKNGRPMGGKPPYGWRRVKTKGQWILVADPSEQRVINYIIHLLDDEGMSMNKVFRHLNEMGIYARCGKPWTWPTFFYMIKRYREDRNPDIKAFERPPHADRGPEEIGQFTSDRLKELTPTERLELIQKLALSTHCLDRKESPDTEQPASDNGD